MTKDYIEEEIESILEELEQLKEDLPEPEDKFEVNTVVESTKFRIY